MSLETTAPIAAILAIPAEATAIAAQLSPVEEASARRAGGGSGSGTRRQADQSPASLRPPHESTGLPSTLDHRPLVLPHLSIAAAAARAYPRRAEMRGN